MQNSGITLNIYYAEYWVIITQRGPCQSQAVSVKIRLYATRLITILTHSLLAVTPWGKWDVHRNKPECAALYKMWNEVPNIVIYI